MHYYTLDKFQKKLDLNSSHKKNDSISRCIASPRINPNEASKENTSMKPKENTFFGKTTSKDLFKRIRILSTDFADAFEMGFFAQLNMARFVLEAVQILEKVVQNTAKSTISNFSSPKPKSNLSSSQTKSQKTPLEIEISALISSFKNMKDDLQSIVTEIEKKPKSLTNTTVHSRAPSKDLGREKLFETYQVEAKSKTKTKQRSISGLKSPERSRPEKTELRLNLNKITEPSFQESLEASQISRLFTTRTNLNNSQSRSFISNIPNTTRESNTTVCYPTKVKKNNSKKQALQTSPSTAYLLKSLDDLPRKQITLTNTIKIDDLIEYTRSTRGPDLDNTTESRRERSCPKMTDKPNSTLLLQKELEETVPSQMNTQEANVSVTSVSSREANDDVRIEDTTKQDILLSIAAKEKATIKKLMQAQYGSSDTSYHKGIFPKF